MELLAVDVLTGQRAALAAASERQRAIFVEQVMTPLEPFWQPVLGWFSAPADDVAPPWQAARQFGYYSPEQDLQAGLTALDRFATADSWAACCAAVEAGCAALVPEQHGVTISTLRYTLLLGDPAKLDERLGSYTGFGGLPGTVQVVAWPNNFNLPRLPAIMAHEFHHNIRFTYEPFIPTQVTVGQYLVAEGLAEAFAAAQHGEALLGPWVHVLGVEQTAALRPRYQAVVDQVGFDLARAYIFGDWALVAQGQPAQGLPDFAGYSIGYQLVQAFLQRQGCSVVEATYLPWQEIVRGSGFFDSSAD